MNVGAGDHRIRVDESRYNIILTLRLLHTRSKPVHVSSLLGSHVLVTNVRRSRSLCRSRSSIIL